jgi:hypothetical protein
MYGEKFRGRLGPLFLAGIMMVAMLPASLAAAATNPCEGAPETEFKDIVTRESGADRFVDEAAKAQIDCVTGYELMVGFADKEFRGDRPLTRAQASSILVNFVSVALGEIQTLPPGFTNPFTDIAGHVQESRILVAFQLGITSGTNATEFKPNQTISREQFASMAAQALDATGIKLEEAPRFARPPDVSPTSVHLPNINRLSAAGVAFPVVFVSGPNNLPSTSRWAMDLDRYSSASFMAGLISTVTVIGGTAWDGRSFVPPSSVTVPPAVDECDELCKSEKDL